MGDVMLIRVKYTDNRYDMIRPEFLDHLIENGAVREFLRRDGWVVPGQDRLRRIGREPYSGPDRRMRREQERRRSMITRIDFDTKYISTERSGILFMDNDSQEEGTEL